jgi:hypothetical protein
MTEERDPLGLMVVLPLTPFGPAVIVVEFEPPASPVTTRHGLPLTTVVPFGPAVTATLFVSAGAVTVRKPIKTASVWMRMIFSKLLQHAAPGREPRAAPDGFNQINAAPASERPSALLRSRLFHLPARRGVADPGAAAKAP